MIIINKLWFFISHVKEIQDHQHLPPKHYCYVVSDRYSVGIKERQLFYVWADEGSGYPFDLQARVPVFGRSNK